jgi:hypothetical protein
MHPASITTKGSMPQSLAADRLLAELRGVHRPDSALSSEMIGPCLAVRFVAESADVLERVRFLGPGV